MLAPALMVQGTASSVGKSLLVAALCRLFRRDGVDVVPFKAQNMSLNAAVTPDGLEIGRAQAMQAEAAGVAASVDMNPILLKPEGPQRAQLVLLGRPSGSFSASAYHERKLELRSVVADALGRLRARHELVIIEGAGSPAEINLRDRDLVNMHVAHLADAQVLLVGDIDRGGVFAAIVGTLALLDLADRERIAGFVINKFRGDRSLLEPGLEFLEQYTGKPVLGVVPHLGPLRLADEDSLSLEDRLERTAPERGELDIAVVALPHLANFDDFTPLEHEPGVSVRFVTEPSSLALADLVILPGTKTTVADLDWLRRTGIAAAVVARALAGDLVLGICGGCQMLGIAILDPERVESPRERSAGLELLNLVTRFQKHKTTAQVLARVNAPSFFAPEGAEISGYEIHMGELSAEPGTARPFRLLSRNGAPIEALDGAISSAGNVVGTLLHGALENPSLREHLLGALRARRSTHPEQPRASFRGIAAPTREGEYDRLETAVRAALDVETLFRLARISRR